MHSMVWHDMACHGHELQYDIFQPANYKHPLPSLSSPLQHTHADMNLIFDPKQSTVTRFPETEPKGRVS